MGGTTDDFCNWRTDSNRGASYLAPPRLGRRANLAGKLFHRLVPLPRAQTRETERAGLATTPIGRDALGESRVGASRFQSSGLFTPIPGLLSPYVSIINVK